MKEFFFPLAAGALFWAPLCVPQPLEAQLTGRPAAEEIARLTQPRDVSIAGNSVDTATGGFSLQATVLEVQGGRSLDFTVMHDSISTPSAIIGPPLLVGSGWTHPYAARLLGRPGGPVVVHWDDLRHNVFDFQSGDYTPRDESARYDRLEEINGVVGCSDCAWRVTREDGTVLLFDEGGVLERVGNKIGQMLEVEKVDGRLVSVMEPISERRLDFFYGPGNRIRYVSDPAERRAYFEYNDDGLLATIHNPASVSDQLGDAFAPIDIPDAGGGALERTVDVVGQANSVGVVILDPTNIGHARVGDLRVILRSPAGTEVDITSLASRPSATVLDFTDVALGQFHGEDPNGRWVLRIVDEQAGETGELNGFRFRLSEATYPTHFRYRDVGLISEATDADGDRLFANVFDNLGRVVAQDDGRDDTPLAMFAYTESADGIVTIYTDRLGSQYRYEHDENYRLRRYLDPLDGETLYEYAPNGDRTAIVDALGRRTELQYDDAGNVTQVTDAAGAVTTMSYTFGKNLSTFTDAEGAETRFNFVSGNITSVTDAENNQDTRQYGASGQLVNVLLEDGAGMDLNYNSSGQATSGSMIHGPSTGGADYDEIGLPSEIEDGLGNKIELEYDGRGNVIRRIDPIGGVEEMDYDLRNRLVRSVDKNGNTTRIVYDGNNNVVARTNALGETSQLVYDVEDRLVEAVDARGGVTGRAYDAVGRLISETNAVGETTRTRYDAVGNVVAIFDAKGTRSAIIAYDQLDLPISSTDALGAVAETRYDRVHRPIETIDPLGRSTTLEYDQIGRLIRANHPTGRSTSQQFRPDDVLAFTTDGEGDSSTFSYDPQNRVTRFTPATGSVAEVRWDYDERGLITRQRLPGSAEKNFEYDDAGRLMEVDYDGEGARPTRQYSYDANGNPTTVRAGGQTLRRTFDALNRVTSFTDAHSDTLRYEYDANGNLSRLTYPGGDAVDYEYDAADRLTAVVDWAGRRTTFTYDANSALTGISFPNGATREMTYDDAGRLVRRRDLSPSGDPIIAYRYRYDAVGLITEEFSGVPDSAPYRPTATTFTYRNDGRFETINGQAATYDARGNLTSHPTNGGAASTFDADNNLISSAGVTYEYDAEDRLIAWTAPTGRTRFTVNPHAVLDQVLVQRAANGATTRFVYGGGLLYEESGGGIRVYHYDQRGSAIAFSDNTGATVGTISYGPFGEVIDQTGQSDSIFQFAGLFGVISGPSGLNYMRFRWYSPELKRFLSPDVHYGDITDPSTLNRYIYAANNPVNFVDPRGEFLGALVGAVVGAVVNTVATVVTAAVTGQPLTPGDLIGAAVGGAITGGLLGACGPPCASAGGLIVAGIAAGGVGGAVGNALGQGIDIATGNQESFDLAEFGLETGLSAAFGAIPFGGKGGKAASNGIRRGLAESAEAAARRGSRASVSSAFRAKAKAFQTVAPKIPANLKHLEPTFGGLFREALGGAPLDLAIGIGQTLLQGALGPDDEDDSSTTGLSASVRDNLAVTRIGLREVNQGRAATFGEHEAWRFYQAVHTLAGRPLPNNPNPALPVF